MANIEHSKLAAACRERDEAYDARFALVGKLEALREQLGDRDQDVKILTKQLGGAVEERDRYRAALVAIRNGDEPPQAIAALALKRRGLRGGR